MTDNPKPISNAELPAALKNFFEQRFAIEVEIADIKAEHLSEITEERKTLITDFKARSGLPNKVVDAQYRLYKLEREAERFQKEADTEQRKVDLSRIWQAVKQGRTLNFVEALEQEMKNPLQPQQPGKSAKAAKQAKKNDDVGETGKSTGKDSAGAGPAELKMSTGEPRPEADPKLEETARAWADQTGGASDDGALDEAGFTFAAGKKAGLDGDGPDKNPHGLDGNESAEIWERGRLLGFRERADAIAKEVASELEGNSQTAPTNVVSIFEGEGGAVVAAGQLGAERPAFPAAAP